MQTGVQGMEFHDHAEHLGEPQQEELDLQSAGSSPNLTYTKLSARDAIMIP